MRRSLTLFAALSIASAGCAQGDGVSVGGGSSAGGGDGSGASGGGAATTGTSHGCFSTELDCGGVCVDPLTSENHCGGCDQPCASGANQTATCVDGQCATACAAGLVPDAGACKSFLGAHESYPNDCPGCATANPVSATCGCPAGSTDLDLAVQSDCPGVPMRAATALRMCVAAATSADSDFGGAYQMDDLAGLCGATAQCRVGNPMAGGACTCPAGFPDVVGLRSIIRLPCDGTETGSQIFVCGNKAAPYAGYAGAFQLDDFAPACRVANPWTGDCSCPAGTSDRVYRVMVDGAMGLYGSTLHLCGP